MGAPAGIKITKADLDEDARGIIVTGFVASESFDQLQVDDYQREELSESKIRILMDAHRTGRVPPVELGMRGNEHAVISDNDVFYLQAPVYIVDGLQRILAAQRLLTIDSEANPRIFATVHLNTDFDWERKRFEVLNLGQTKVSGNVTLRNMRYEIEVVEVLYRLSQSKAFILGDRIAWEQSMKRGELISGITFASTVGMLHSHVGPGRSKGAELARGLQKIMQNSGKGIFTRNVKTFFDTIDVCWGIKSVAYRKTAVQLKLGFLLALARMFSDHTNFWDGSTLKLDTATLRKLGTFPLHDPAVATLSNQGGKSSEHLAQLIADHINSGRRTNRLVRRSYGDEIEVEEVIEESDEQ